MRQYSSFTIVLVLWLAGLCAAAQFAKMAHTIPELRSLYPDAGALLGFLVSLISLIGALFGLIAGMMVGQFGPRRVLLTGLALGAILSFVQSFTLPFSVILVTRFIEGASHLAIVVAAPTLIAQHSSDRLRAAAMTLWGTFFGVSFALTAWLGLPLVAERGINALFMAHALITALTLLLVFVTVTANDTRPTGTVSGLFGPKEIINRHKDAWSSANVAAPALGWLFYTVTFVSLLAVLPGLMLPDQRAVMASVLPVAGIVSSMTMGIFLLRRYNAVQVVKTGFFLAICFSVFLALFPAGPLVSICLFLALGLVQGASFASIPQLNATATDQALANGTLAQAGNIGNLIGTPFLIMTLNYFGIIAITLVLIVCYSAGIYGHVLLEKRRKANYTN